MLKRFLGRLVIVRAGQSSSRLPGALSYDLFDYVLASGLAANSIGDHDASLRPLRKP